MVLVLMSMKFGIKKKKSCEREKKRQGGRDGREERRRLEERERERWKGCARATQANKLIRKQTRSQREKHSFAHPRLLPMPPKKAEPRDCAKKARS